MSRHNGLPDPYSIFLYCGCAWTLLLFVYSFAIYFHQSDFRNTDIALIMTFILVSFVGALYFRFNRHM